MTAPRIVRCCECGAPIALYGDDDPEPLCFRCCEIVTNPLAAGPLANPRSHSEACSLADAEWDAGYRP